MKGRDAADGDPVASQVLGARLSGWGYDMMPGLDGPAVCRRVRAMTTTGPRYLIMLAARDGAESAAEGLDSGADDFLARPFDCRELRARHAVGARDQYITDHTEVAFSHGICPACYRRHVVPQLEALDP